MHDKSMTERTQLGLYSQADIHRLCGVSQVKLCRLVKNGIIPKPTHPYGGKLFYSSDEIQTVCKAIQQSSTHVLQSPKS
jgi:hypothetical protein